MIFAKMLLPATLLMFLIALPVGYASSSYQNGYVSKEGYTYKDGFWWKADCAYTRKQVSVCYNGCYSYKYVYSKVPVATKEVVSSADPDWRTKLLDIAAQRDKYEMKNRLEAFNQYFFIESINALGLKGGFSVQGYGGPPPYQFGLANPGATYQLSTAGANGSTIYGYGYSTTHQIYGDNYLPGLYQQLARVTENAQKLAGQAGVDFKDAVTQEGHNRAKVAEFLAKGQVVAEALRAMDQGSAKLETREFHFKMHPDGRVERIETPNVAAPVPNGNLALDALIRAECATCHNTKDADRAGKLDLTNWKSLAPEQWGEVVSRVMTRDPSKGMPRGGDGKHRPLSAEKKALFLSQR